MKNAIRSLLFAVAFSTLALQSSAQFSLSIGITVRTAPPPLPVYIQPECPLDGYLWCPGYWAYDDFDGYYWVPGAWVLPPMIDYLWTPGYWGYGGGIYGWHGGYWGRHIGFYGGINYGCGYWGSGFAGGAWQGGRFRYNTAVVNVNTTVVHNTYVDRTVINNTTINNTTINNHASFNGAGGATARPSAQEQAAIHESHVPPTTQQFSHNQSASKDRNQFASVNKGRPVTTAMDKPGGSRFNPQGKNAPAPVERPATGTKPAGSNARAAGNLPNGNTGNKNAANNPGNQSLTKQAQGNGQSKSNSVNRPVQQDAHRPVQSNPVNHPIQQDARRPVQPNPASHRIQQNTDRPPNHPVQQNNNRPPVQSRPRQQPPRNDSRPQHAGGEGSHHK